MIEVKEEPDGSLTINWDETDPIESLLNHWTEQDFIDAIMEGCKRRMEVTEHNITEWKLRRDEIEVILTLLKEEIKKYPDQKKYYGTIIAKLALMKVELDESNSTN